MVSLKKYVSCKCGASNSFSFDSDMNVEEISISARCPMCGATIHVSVSSLLSAPSQSQAPSSPSTPAISEPIITQNQEQQDRETKENVEQAVRDLFKY